MTKKRNWRIAGLTAALLLGVVSFLLVSHGRTAAGEAAASAPDVAGRMGSVAAAYVVGERGPQTHHFTPKSFRARYVETFGAEPALPSQNPALSG